MANQGGGEKVQFKNNPMSLATDFVAQYKQTFKYDYIKDPADVKLFNSLSGQEAMSGLPLLKALQKNLQEPNLTILVADLLFDNEAIKPKLWVNREAVRSVLRIAANLDIGEFKADAIDKARGREVKVDPRQAMIENLLKKLEEKSSPLPIEARG